MKPKPPRQSPAAITHLRLRYAHKTGQLVECILCIGCESPRWWRWTTSLGLAIALERAVVA